MSVICPIYNEEKYIAQCIESILQQDFPKSDMELLFVDGLSTDNTRNIVNEYSKKYNFIKLLDNPHKVVPYAMNTGINNSQGDIIIRLDAHVIYPENYFSELINKLKYYDADNVGCCCETLPVNDSTTAIAIAETLSSPFGVGNSMFRIGVTRDMEVDTVPFGCYKRSTFDKIGLYDLDLTRNQDDELNARLLSHGGKIMILANMTVKYYARDTFSKLFKMYYQYGLYKPLVNRKIGKPATIRQLVPPFFVLGLVFGLLFSSFSTTLFFAYIITLLLYVFVGVLIGIKMAIKHKRVGLILFMPYSFFVIHCGYGIGYIVGLYKILFNKSFSVETNR